MTHFDDDELGHLADAILSGAEMQDIDPHLSTCEQCRDAVLEALRGLALLAQASEPPADLEQHVRARRWATARDDLPLPGYEDDEDIAEVGGRGKEDGSTTSDDPSKDNIGPAEND